MLIECDKEGYLKYIKDDPVRPDLFDDDAVRFDGNFRVYADIDRQGFGINVNAIICVVIAPFIPQNEKTIQDFASGDLKSLAIIQSEEGGSFEPPTTAGKVLCPYSLWSYEKGAGRRLVNSLLEAVPIMYPDVDYVITMSPPTKMAMNFHTSNGASMLSPNKDTVNYEYEIENYGVSIH